MSLNIADTPIDTTYEPSSTLGDSIIDPAIYWSLIGSLYNLISLSHGLTLLKSFSKCVYLYMILTCFTLRPWNTPFDKSNAHLIMGNTNVLQLQQNLLHILILIVMITLVLIIPHLAIDASLV